VESARPVKLGAAARRAAPKKTEPRGGTPVAGDEGCGPGDTGLDALLGRSRPLWDRLIAHVTATYPPVAREWKVAGRGGDWYLRLRRGERTILYLLPRVGYFITALVLGEKATAAVRASDVPRAVIAALNEARPYAEGRGLRLETRTGADLATIRTLAAIKMNH
jgi:hypothetical protein